MTITLNLPSGKFVVAVSGGVDSMVLLDLACKSVGSENIIAAHFDHMVRPHLERKTDIHLIEKYTEANSIRLQQAAYQGDDKSEAAMREARYQFLEKVRIDYKYNSVITGHHLDDLVETAIINLMRGTKGAGLNSITNSGTLLRPMLEFTKQEIREYAQQNDILWHEDSTNTDIRYLRNYVRAKIVPALRVAKKYEEFVSIIREQKPLEESVQELVSQSLNANNLQYEKNKLKRAEFINLPHDVSMRFMHEMMKNSHLAIESNKDLVLKATIFAKTATSGSAMDLSSNTILKIGDNSIEFIDRD